jgi:hypothetical protein
MQPPRNHPSRMVGSDLRRIERERQHGYKLFLAQMLEVRRLVSLGDVQGARAIAYGKWSVRGLAEFSERYPAQAAIVLVPRAPGPPMSDRRFLLRVVLGILFLVVLVVLAAHSGGTT